MIKYLIPILIIGIVLIWLGLYGFAILSIPMGSGLETVFKITGLTVVVCVMGIAVKVLVDRIREIKKEDEDDYRQY
jgi:ammonia channel protein AmtB